MKEQYEDPPRWREHRDQRDRAERALGQDLRAIKTPAPLSGPQMARIAAGLRPGRAPSLRWLMVAASLVLLMATAASAAHLNLLPRWLTGTSAPPPLQPPEPRAGQRKPSLPRVGHAPAPQAALNPPEGTPTSSIDETAPPAPTIPEQPVSVQPAAPRQVALLAPAPRKAEPRARSEGAAPALELPQTMPGPLAQPSAKPLDDTEVSTLLAEALRLVRADGQPRSALALLDRNATRLNRSPYRHEALLIRVDALLALERDAELLRLLDGVSLADVAASRTLLVTRGRLRAAAERCVEAVADFDRALAEPGRKDKQALLGRALCRERLGDVEGAKADRARYRSESLRTGP